MIGHFEVLLDALGKVFHLKLHVDQKNACSIRLGSDLTVQLQLDQSQENLWIFSKLAEVPPGKFRENVLQSALRANGKPDPLSGTLGFIGPQNMLALFQQYPLHLLNGENLAETIGAFVETAESWRGALQSGRSSP